MYQTGCSAYRQSAANTIEDKRVILLKLYDGALIFIKIAKRGIQDNSPRIRGENIGKTMAIISELQAALDHEKGGKISTNLDALYRFAMDRLLFASSNNDIEALNQVEKVLTTLKEGFESALKEQKRAAAASAAPLPVPPVMPGISAPAPQAMQYAAL